MNTRLLLPVFAFLLLPSCISWNIGTRIKEAKVTQTGLDVSRHVGEVYESPSDKGYYYMQVPVVAYHERTPLIRVHPLELGGGVAAVDVKDTGKVQWTRARPRVDKLRPREPGQAVTMLPQDLVLAPHPASMGRNLWAKELGVLDSTEDEGYNTAALLAAPCTYVLDPALTVACTAVAVPTAAVAGTAYMLWTVVTSPIKKAVRAVIPEKKADAEMPEAPVVMP